MAGLMASVASDADRSYGEMRTTRHMTDVLANFEDIVRTRTFTRSFDKDRSIDPVLIERLLRLSQMAPSSFNLQPYKMILVQDEAARAALADTMLGGNGQRVLDAPLTIVYLSDKGTDSFFLILDN